jgi:transcriptional repressor NrdR
MNELFMSGGVSQISFNWAAFDRHKVLAGIQRACQKRPVSAAAVEGIVQEIENELLEVVEREVPSSWIGQRVMERLQALDDVAYVRFASVYRQFKDISEFMSELKGLLDGKTPAPPPDRAGRG